MPAIRQTLLLCLAVAGWCCAAGAALAAPQFIFGTLAGNAGYGSADGLGASARFDFPEGVAADGAGNVYVADTENSTIRKITPAGLVSTLAGVAGSPGSADTAAGVARFSHPQGLAVDAMGNVYVADTRNSTIRMITPVGVVSTLAGSPGVIGISNGINSAALFNLPGAVAADAAGNLYVADTYNSTIRRLTPSGSNWVVTTLAGAANANANLDGTNTSARFYWPSGIAVDTNRNLYVADTGNNAIRRITPAGSNWVTTTIARQIPCAGLSVDDAGNVYVADSADNTIRKFSLAGANWVMTAVAGFSGAVGSADGLGTNASFNYPHGITAAIDGTLCVADSLNNSIRQITPTGMVSTFAGLAGGPGSSDGNQSQARFSAPLGVAVDAGANVYVADSQNNTVRMITPAGVVTTLAGVATNLAGSVDGFGTNAAFNLPAAVAVDSATNVYVADFYNNEIRKLTPTGTNWVVTTLAGRAGATDTWQDGTGTNALFYHPSGLALDSVGILYVADGSTNGVRLVTPAGSVTTLAGSVGAYAVTNQFGSSGVAVDGAGNVFVSDKANNTIRQIAPGGSVTTLAGSPGLFGTADGTNATARFASPTSLALDTQGNLYVTDALSDTLRKLAPLGTNWVVTTVAGSAGVAGSVDGPDLGARFNNLAGIAVDASGNLYVADTGNNTIRFGQNAQALVSLPVALQISLSAGQVVVSWPTSAVGFILETNVSPGPGSSWQTSANAPIAAGASLAVTNGTAAAATFYRLRKP